MKKIIINNENSKQRIDKFLAREFFSYTRGEIIRQIKAGKILVNDEIVKPSYVLKEKDEIEVRIKKQEARSKKAIIFNTEVKIKVTYEDENIIIVNKPAGLSVHPSFKNETDTLANGLILKFPEIKTVGDEPEIRPGIVHRLDRDTSGVMVVARNQKTFEELKNKFKNREIEKKYMAIVYGQLKDKKGTIEKPIARSSNYKRQVIAGRKTRTKIRPAITEYEVIREWSNFSLVEAVPKTGRMHQIRVHLASIGHPILGDKIYKLKNNRNILRINRPACNDMRSIAGSHLLHAKDLKFELFGKKYSFEAPLSKDFSKQVAFLDGGEIRG